MQEWYSMSALWRGVRAAEGARLESVYIRKYIKGSNPFPSNSLIFVSSFEEPSSAVLLALPSSGFSKSNAKIKELSS